MKPIFNLLCFCFCFAVYSQQVKIEGFAVDSTKGRSRVTVSINDTIRKFEKADRHCYPANTWNKLNENYSTLTNFKSGFFSINADKSDSLTFYSDFSFEKYISQTHSVSDLLDMDEIKIELEPEVCIEHSGCYEEPEIYAFVGEVIKVKEVEEIYYCDYLSLDNKYKAKLKIKEQVYNTYKNDTITFFAYDHYGTPKFSEYKNVLIYVSESCDVFYHAKYLFSPTYKVDGKWKITYSKPRHELDSLLAPLAKPVKFSDEVYYELGDKLTEAELDERFPKTHFYRDGSFVKPLYGYDVKDVFQIMKRTRLKDYGFFQKD